MANCTNQGRRPDLVSAELDGARQNALSVKRITHPKDNYDMLASAILLVIQHLEKEAQR